MKVIAGTGFTFLCPLWLCTLASRIALVASTYKGTSTWALNKSFYDLQESLRSLLYIWAKALFQTLSMLFHGVQTLFRSPLTLFFCKTCSALLTLFRAWTLVDPFSFGWKKSREKWCLLGNKETKKTTWKDQYKSNINFPFKFEYFTFKWTHTVKHLF